MTVTSAYDLEEANPDILDFDAVTGCRMDIKEDRTEIMREGPEGKEISYNPPRYMYSYNFRVIISVRNPYFDEMRLRLNSSDVEMTPMPGSSATRPGSRFMRGGFDPMDYPEYRKYYNMADEICQAVDAMREQPSASPAPAAGPWTCPACGAQNSSKFCESCGSPRP